jgi:hypothetical protein
MTRARRVALATGLGIIIILVALALIGQCSGPVEQRDSIKPQAATSWSTIEKNVDWTPPASSTVTLPTLVKPLIVAKSSEPGPSPSAPTEEVPEQSPEQAADQASAQLAPLPAISPPPKPAPSQRNVCAPGWRQTFYYRGVLHWRCRY